MHNIQWNMLRNKMVLCSVVVPDGLAEGIKCSSVASSTTLQHNIMLMNATKVTWIPELKQEYHILALPHLSLPD